MTDTDDGRPHHRNKGLLVSLLVPFYVLISAAPLFAACAWVLWGEFPTWGCGHILPMPPTFCGGLAGVFLVSFEHCVHVTDHGRAGRGQNAAFASPKLLERRRSHESAMSILTRTGGKS